MKSIIAIIGAGNLGLSIASGLHQTRHNLVLTRRKNATQTTYGAARLLIESGNHPEAEIDRVTTPSGCTITGLNVMEHSGMSSAFIQGLTASFDKINEIKSTT